MVTISRVVPTRYYVGWDVGAWNCDDGDSRDAVCVLSKNREEVVLIGRPWRGNLREILNSNPGVQILQRLLERCQVSPQHSMDVTIGIDAPLGWPEPMLNLINRRVAVSVPKKADDNPYLFRKTDLRLFERHHRPLSPVRDMIGSQSLKGLHFLRSIGAFPTNNHTWIVGTPEITATAFETYPTPCRNHPVLQSSFSRIRSTDVFRSACRNWPNVTADLKDALTCSLVAWLFKERFDAMLAPDPDISKVEGWIWLPAEAIQIAE